MLEYEWGSPSTIMLTGSEDPTQDPGQTHRQIFDQYPSQTLLPDHLTSTTGPANFSQLHLFSSQTEHTHHHHHHPSALFDPRAFTSASSSCPPPPSMLSLDTLTNVNNTTPCGPDLFLVPKTEEVSRHMDFSASRIGLNLGGRTYFSSDDDIMTGLYRRARPTEPGPATANSPRCQAEGCNADLSHAKHYHRRHKVCEFHSKAATVIAAGLTQRFCQQCSRFHLLSEFDNGKRSCRKRLADHNRRRRKSHQNNIARSCPDSGAYSLTPVVVAVSPPDYFGEKHHGGTKTSSATSSSLFFSSA